MNYIINLWSIFTFWFLYLNNEGRKLIMDKVEWLSKQDPRIERLFQYIFWYIMKTTTIFTKKYNILSNSVNKYIIEPFMLYNFGHKDPEDVLFIKDGNIIYKTAYMYVNDSDTKSDMILYEWTMPEESKYESAVMRFNDKSEVSDNFKTSKVSFLATELLIKNDDNSEDKYSIDFKKDNYYIVNNILFDRIFITYWCKEKLNIDLNYNCEYEVTFLDNDMAHNTIKSNQYIILYSDEYEVVEL